MAKTGAQAEVPRMLYEWKTIEDGADNLISGFRREVDENCAVLMVPIGCPETSIISYRSKMLNILEDGNSE